MKQKLQLKDVKISDMERIIIQEKGEKFFADKNASKSRQWLERVEDEKRRESIREKIDYFSIDTIPIQQYGAAASVNHHTQPRQSRRIIGYTLGRSVSTIKEKLLKMLRHNQEGAAGAPKPRKRANSSENVLQVGKEEDVPSAAPPVKLGRPPRNFRRNAASQICFDQKGLDEDTQSD